MNRQLTAIIERDGDRYAALCPFIRQSGISKSDFES